MIKGWLWAMGLWVFGSYGSYEAYRPYEAYRSYEAYRPYNPHSLKQRNDDKF